MQRSLTHSIPVHIQECFAPQHKFSALMAKGLQLPQWNVAFTACVSWEYEKENKAWINPGPFVVVMVLTKDVHDHVHILYSKPGGPISENVTVSHFLFGQFYSAQIPSEVDHNVLYSVNFSQEGYCVTSDWAIPCKIQALFSANATWQGQRSKLRRYHEEQEELAVRSSASFIAETSVSSPRKLFIFII